MYIARIDNADKSVNQQTKFLYLGYLNISIFDVIYRKSRKKFFVDYFLNLSKFVSLNMELKYEI